MTSLWLIGFAILALDFVSVIRLIGTETTTPTQKAYSLFLIFGLPVVGPLIVLAMLNRSAVSK